MQINKIPLWAALVLGVLAVGTVQARDTRIDAVEQLLMARWDTIPEDIVVEIVVDPTVGQSERYEVLRFFLEKQKAVARHREHVQQNYLPRLERMFREMPGEDCRSCRLILQAMASLRQERDQGRASTIEFLRQQADDEALAEHKRAVCRALLDQIQGRSAAETSSAWQAEDRRIAGLVAKGAAGEAYRAALTILRADEQPVGDRLGALEWLDQMLACPTGVSFEQTRKDLTAVCSTAAQPMLAKALVGSILRAAFLEELDSEHVMEVLKGLAQQQQTSVREAAEAELAQLDAQRRSWVLNLQEHLEQVDRLVQQANLEASARQEYRELIEDPDYYAHPVGESPRWWVLGKFLQRQKATRASIEAFRRYLQTREPTAHVDDSLREAVKILAEQRAVTGQEPLAYWMDIARQPRARGARAFVKAMVETLSQAADRRVLVQFAISALQQGEQPDLSEAVLEGIVLSTQDVAGLASSDARGRYCRTAIAAALAREGKAAKAAEHVDLTLQDPLPTVPLFRAVGVADALFAAGKPEAGEALVRALMRRPGATSQRPNLLVYLMNQKLKAGQTPEAIQVQDELSQGYGLDSPETVVEALGKCIAVVRDKNPEAEIASTRLLCEILNGDTYRGLREEAAGSKEAVIFWRAVLEWSQDHEEVAGLEEFVRKEPESREADLARVLLARCALEGGQREAAAEWLKGVGETSAVSALAKQEQRRLDALQDRDRALREELGAIRSQCADADVQATCEALLAEMDRTAPPAPLSQQNASGVREGADGEAYADAMHQIGLALRAARRYQLAAGCFHKGFVGAPYAKASADLLKEEAWTLRFCLAMMDESDVRLKQLVAIYPHHAAARWARTYLSTQANLLHPE
jgi:tetratricopeptide (TPR) repeat protein